MTFTLLHTADWHIGKPFGRLPAGPAYQLQRARLGAIDRLAAAARNAGARHILVGGDTFDQPGLSDKLMREPLARIAAHSGLVWHIIPGNHDPATPDGIWERVVRDGLPGNVRLHLESRPVELETDHWLLPAPLTSKATSTDPTLWMDDAPTPAGAIRIGLAHGSAYGFGSERTASVGIAPMRANTAGLAYLALGDWHGAREVGPRTWYSGTPEPDSYQDNEPGHALVVRITGGAEASVEKVQIGEHRWLERQIDLTRTSDLDRLESEIDDIGTASSRLLIDLALEGRISLAEDRELKHRLDRLEARVLHLERGLDRLVLAPVDADMEALGDGDLGEIARDLSSMAADEANPDRPAAARALRRLLALADDAARANA